MASLRMELSRDGLDDYDYLEIYSKLSGGKELPQEVKNMMPVLNKGGGIIFKVNSNKDMQKFRKIIARKIVEIKKQQGAKLRTARAGFDCGEKFADHSNGSPSV